MKTIYEMLKPELKKELQESARKYSTAKRLKYTLMSKNMWYDLSISDVTDLITFTNHCHSKMSAYDFMYGTNLINKN